MLIAGELPCHCCIHPSTTGHRLPWGSCKLSIDISQLLLFLAGLNCPPSQSPPITYPLCPVTRCVQSPPAFCFPFRFMRYLDRQIGSAIRGGAGGLRLSVATMLPSPVAGKHFPVCVCSECSMVVTLQLLAKIFTC